MQRMVMLRLLDDDDCNSSYILQPIVLHNNASSNKIEDQCP